MRLLYVFHEIANHMEVPYHNILIRKGNLLTIYNLIKLLDWTLNRDPKMGIKKIKNQFIQNDTAEPNLRNFWAKI